MNLVSETAAQLAGNRLPDAVECGERAVEATRRLRWHAAEVRALRLLGTALAATGDRERARVSLDRAADALTLSGLPRNPRDPLLPPDVASL
ncbi:hypothetical protein [Streptomyces lavendulae]